MKWLAPLALLLLTACQTQLPRATLYTDHDLTNKIWSVSGAEFIPREELIKAASKAKFVLLGEKHDNPDHHRYQAEILRSLIKAGRRPAVAFEMLTWEQQTALDGFVKSRPKNAAGLGKAVKWQQSGWPDWSWYAPIADAALVAELPIVAANFPRSHSRKLARQGFAALPANLLFRSKLDVPLSSEQFKRLEDDIFVSHCEMMPRKHLGAVIKVQQARDAVLADALIEGLNSNDGAVLIAGSGHVRSDRAVPRYLRLRQPEARIFSLAFIEVDGDTQSPADYAEPWGGSFPFDYVWFTARLEDIDPCEKFRTQLQKMKKKS
jgi:uncharacterized iron-regulated protein